MHKPLQRWPNTNAAASGPHLPRNSKQRLRLAWVLMQRVVHSLMQ
jgi:hypothetical protein